MTEADETVVYECVIDGVGKDEGDTEIEDDVEILSRAEMDGRLLCVSDILKNAEIDNEANDDGDSLAIANRENVATLLEAPESL